MDDSRLDEFSQRFAAALFGAFPKWRQYAALDNSGGNACAMHVAVPPRADAPGEASLWISTEDEEITVGFDSYHVHFNRYGDDEEAKSFEEAIAFARDVVHERVVVFSWWFGDQWRGSTTATPDSVPSTPEWAKSANQLRIRSWRGSYDSDRSA